MKKINFLILLLVFVLGLSPSAAIAATPERTVIITPAGAGLSGTGAAMNNAISVGQTAISGVMADGTNRLRLGIMGALTTDIATPAGMRFSNPVPLATDVQASLTVTIGVTATITGARTIQAMGFRIANDPAVFTGPTPPPFTEVPITQGLQTVTVTTTVSSGFMPGSDNWVQWAAIDSTGALRASDAYQVVLASDIPFMTFISPAKNTDNLNMPAALVSPNIQVRLYPQNPITVPDITVRIYQGNSAGGILVYETPSGGEGSLQNNIYTLPVPPQLVMGMQYYMVVSYNDGGNTVSASILFTMQSSQNISELVPFPSPFDPAQGNLRIRYVLGRDSTVTINIYNRAGRLVRVLVDSQRRPAGRNEEQWDGRNFSGAGLANGIYIIEVIVDGGRDRRFTSVGLLGR